MQTLISLDLGNTSAHLALFVQDQILWEQRFAIGQEPDWPTLRQLLPEPWASHPPEGAGISSVTPSRTEHWQKVLAAWCQQPPLVIEAAHLERLGMRLEATTPGIDRLINCFAAWQLWQKDCLVLDMGTATTLDAITREGIFLGGAILPGLELSANALFARAEQLPRIEMISDGRFIGKNTIQAMQSGIILGYAAMVDRLMEKFSQEAARNFQVIGTGGLVHKIAPHSENLKQLEERLTLQGVAMVTKRLS